MTITIAAHTIPNAIVNNTVINLAIALTIANFNNIAKTQIIVIDNIIANSINISNTSFIIPIIGSTFNTEKN